MCCALDDAPERSGGERDGPSLSAKASKPRARSRSAPQSGIRGCSALNRIGQLSTDVASEDLVELTIKAIAVRGGQRSDVLPLALVGDALTQPFCRQICRTNRVEVVALSSDGGPGRERVRADRVGVVERVDLHDVPISLEHPVPAGDVVAQTLNEPPRRRQPQWPHLIELVNGTVDVSAADRAVGARARSV